MVVTRSGRNTSHFSSRPRSRVSRLSSSMVQRMQNVLPYNRQRRSWDELRSMYPMFDFPTPRRKRKPDGQSKGVIVRTYRRRAPLGQPS